MSEELIISEDPTRVSYFSRFYPDIELSEIADTIPWRQNKIRVFGKEHDEPRLTAWYGPPYTYSNVNWPEAAIPPILQPIWKKLNKTTGFAFNSVLLNLYRDGNDAMGWHRDNEREMDSGLIASVSFGATRSFRIRRFLKNRDTFEGEKKESWSVELEHGSLLLMEHLQKQFEHSIPRRKKVTEPRLNLTFRRIIA